LLACCAQHTRFDMMSTTILSRIDDLGSQLDELERAVGDLAVAVRACTRARSVSAPAERVRGVQAESHAGDAAGQQHR
jgi:hypothetical protein